jgi:NAD(P)-dependent dehydrogenase (short-subunit alcohol dehydrogenase family)
VTQTVERYGRLDSVANCVGSLLLKPAHLTSNAEWNITIATNLGSAFTTVRTAARAMMKTGSSIVRVSSVAARLGLANHEAIAAAQAGMRWWPRPCRRKRYCNIARSGGPYTG